MKIQLSQPNIERALVMYLEAQGIKLGTSDVAITFTAGRKQGGLTADVEFDDVATPTAPVGVVNRPEFTPRAVVPIAAEAPEEVAPVAEVAQVAEEVVEEEAIAGSKGTSLFG